MEKRMRERLQRTFGRTPKWAEDFPVDQRADTSISRRDFIRYLALISLGLFTGTLGMLGQTLQRRRSSRPAVPAFKILDHTDLAVGESHVFRIPERDENAILIRLAERDYVAYGQKCTHLQSPVLWKPGQDKLLCPCHKGAFSVRTGKVLYGPPERALPRVRLDVRPDGVYFAGMKEEEVV